MLIRVSPLYWGGDRVGKGLRSPMARVADPEPRKLLLSFSRLPGTELEVSLSTYVHSIFIEGDIRRARQILGTHKV